MTSEIFQPFELITANVSVWYDILFGNEVNGFAYFNQ